MKKIQIDNLRVDKRNIKCTIKSYMMLEKCRGMFQ